jgi:hypothetical protein
MIAVRNSHKQYVSYLTDTVVCVSNVKAVCGLFRPQTIPQVFLKALRVGM